MGTAPVPWLPGFKSVFVGSPTGGEEEVKCKNMFLPSCHLLMLQGLQQAKFQVQGKVVYTLQGWGRYFLNVFKLQIQIHEGLYLLYLSATLIQITLIKMP